jgi:hypothetical protein
VIHLVLDNGSSHVSKQTKTWLAAHPRFQAHYTPKRASWLNQVGRPGGGPPCVQRAQVVAVVRPYRE